MTKLLITNGDIAVNQLKQAEINATFLPWRDMLHCGPVPETPGERELLRIRADFLADGTVNTYDEILSDMSERNAHLDRHEDYKHIELWFEHDLYDQLQLIEILSMLNARKRTKNISIVQTQTYLSMQTPEKIAKLKNLSKPIAASFIERATQIWKSFRQTAPKELYLESCNPVEGFPVMHQALRRALQELPGLDGLSRTQRQIIYSLNRGVNRTGMLFARVNNMEEAAFLGDTGFFSILSELEYCKNPLLEGLSETFEPSVLQDTERRKAFIQSNITLTDLGKDILAAQEDNANHNSVDWWLGGTHITNDTLWRWDDETEQLIAPD